MNTVLVVLSMQIFKKRYLWRALGKFFKLWVLHEKSIHKLIVQSFYYSMCFVLRGNAVVVRELPQNGFSYSKR